MKNDLTDESLLRLSNHLAQHMGINFSAERFTDLKTKMTALADAFEFEDVEEFAAWLLSDKLSREQIELLADFLTVGETYFFRDPKSFLVLENEIFPQLIDARQNTRFMRIWSAACCTGEEPYSIAMLLRKMIPDVDSWQINILGTDINQTFLERATEGLYGDWSFRATPDFYKERYFKPKKNRFQIDTQIKKMVRFEWMNLAELECLDDPNYSSMDLIFCRNVLIYFSQEHATKIITSLSKCLIPDGYLFVGPNELTANDDRSYNSLHRNGAIVLQKANHIAAEIQRLADVDSGEGLQIKEVESGSGAHMNQQIPTLEEAQARYDQALYQEAVELLLLRCKNGGDFSTMVLLAKSFANHSDLKSALKWCDQAIKVNRLNAATHYLRATILQEQGANSEAIHSLKQALLMDSSFVLAEFNLGILLKHSGNLRDAQRHFKATLKLLGSYDDNDILPESEGTTASGMRVIVSSLMADTPH
ncbi:MAG: hypothetical protein JST89_07820 [Cyanobacteria bacterium SZAS-4]|nr:hypothetical protein [Cyanobacteria bacterium SZAS-4]